MPTLQEIIQSLEQAGKNINDFNITVFDGGYKIEPRASFEPRQIAKEEDAPIKNELAITQDALDALIMGGV